MENSNLFCDGRIPTSLQLNNKIRHVRKLVHGTQQIFDTHELREKVKEKLNIPEDEITSYIAYYSIDDENEDEDPRFTLIWTSKKLLRRMSDEFTQDDATYRLLWQGSLNLYF